MEHSLSAEDRLMLPIRARRNLDFFNAPPFTLWMQSGPCALFHSLGRPERRFRADPGAVKVLAESPGGKLRGWKRG